MKHNHSASFRIAQTQLRIQKKMADNSRCRAIASFDLPTADDFDISNIAAALVDE